MTQLIILGEAELLDIIRAAPAHEQAVRLAEILDRVLAGTLRIVGQRSEPLQIAVIFTNLMRSLDAVLRFEMVTWAVERAEETFANETPPVDGLIARNLLGAAATLLPGQPILLQVLAYAEQSILNDATSPELALAAGQLLYDMDALGDGPEPWMKLVTRWVDSSTPVAVSALCALMKRWPQESLDFLIATCAAASKSDEGVQRALANLISLAADDLTAGVGFEQFARSYSASAEQLAPAIRSALDFAASERGWEVKRADLPRNNAIVTVEPRRSLPVQIGARADNKDDAIQMGEARALVCRFDRSQGEASIFPARQIEEMRVMREDSSFSYDRAGPDGFEELSFVRSAVEAEINARAARADESSDEELLDAVTDQLGVHSLAKEAVRHLVKLGYGSKPFLFGASEFHQDRLLMHVAAAALRRAGLMGTKIYNRPWEDPSLWIKSANLEANIVTGAGVVTKPTPFGIFEFTGFRVFVRIDALRALAETPGADLIEAVPQLISVAERGGDVYEKIDLTARAKLVLHLGEVDAKGSAFEELRGAIERIAGVPESNKEEPVEISNDEAFERFITGDAAIYCGGAINSLLIETWWAKAQPNNYIELLNHSEIARGFRAEPSDGPAERPPYVENSLKFGLSGQKRTVRDAEIALTRLFRAVGRGLQRWSNEVMKHPDKLNGSTKSCEAARQILRPLHLSRSGKYAFATLPSDPARLLKQTDRFYSDREGRVH